MDGMEWLLEIVLIILLGATLVQAIRLERALSVLKRDRTSLESLVVGFNASTHQAESGIQQLRAVADGAGRNIESQLSRAVALKDDLGFLTERGDRIADRLDGLVRTARPLAQERSEEANAPKGVGHTERDLLNTLRMAR
jgi:uncharacterized protein DUF6468